MRNLPTASIIACYRFICNHPFLVCFLGILIYLYRWSPYAFSIFVYVSPVLVCTAVLLGTLIFYGQSNIPEVEKEKKIDGISSFQMGFSEGATVIADRDENTSIIEERSIKEASLAGDKVNNANQGDGLPFSNVPAGDKKFLKIQHEKQVKKEMEREVHAGKSTAKSFSSDAEAVHEEEESLETRSDDTESSSLDVSMDDINPGLDELHPLLDQGSTQPVSRASSVIAYGKSQKSDEGSVESYEGTEIQGYEEDEMESGIEDESKSAIKWTEDDQKNLMDLRSLELERNQRLENVIARRRAWRQTGENSLKDLERTDHPSNLSPISTRCNPFDLPDESYVAMGLPPIPGSAPSHLRTKNNPFDIPYDLNEEKPDPKGDNPQEECTIFNQKDTFLRRHESFSMGPSVLGMTKPERQDFYWKPIFVSEQLASEGTSYSSFQWQSSEVSHSKLSSVPDAESVSSIDHDERMCNEQDLPQETESVSTIDHAGGVECGNQSSGEVDSADTIKAKQRNVHRDEVEVVLGGMENPSAMEICPETGEAAIHDESNIGETQFQRVVADEEGGNKSSPSSLSEVIDNISCEKQEKSVSVQPGEKDDLQGSRISAQASVEDSNFQSVNSEVVENQHIEPLYDSSPPAARKLQTFYSAYYDFPPESSESTSPPASEGRTVNVRDEISGLHHQGQDDKTTGEEEFHLTSYPPHMEQANTELHQDLDKKAASSISNYQYVQSEVKPPSELENNLSGSDKFVAKPFVSVHIESRVKFVESVSISNNGAGEIKDAMDKFHLNASSVTYDSSETPEFKSPTGESPKNVKKMDAKQGIPILEVRSTEDIDLAFKQLQEGADVEEIILPSMIKVETEQGIPVLEVRSPEDIDSAFKQLQEGADVKEVILPSMIKAEAEQGIPILEVRSAEDINLAFKQLQEGANVNEVILPSMIKTEAEQGIPILEVRSAEDINSAFKQLQEGADVKEVILPSMIKAEAKHGISVLELRSVEDIDSAFKQLQEGVDVKEVILPSMIKAEVEQGIPVLEVRSAEDINSAFKQLQEGADVKEVILPSMIKAGAEQGIPILEVRSAKDINSAFKQLQEGADVKDVILPSMIKAEAKQGIPVLELRSTEDIDSAFKQLQEGVDVKEVILPSMIEAEAEQGIPVIELRSAEDINSAFKQLQEGAKVKDVILPSMIKAEAEQGIPVLEVRSNEDINSAFKQLQEGADVKEVILPSMIKAEAKQGIPILEVRSAEDIDSAFKQLQEGADVKEVSLPSMIKAEAEHGIPDLEVRSAEDINSAIKQLQEGADVEEVILPSMIKAEAKQGIPVLEVKSAEDIDLAFKQLQEGVDVEEIILPSMIKDHLTSEKSKGYSKANSGLQVVEARSLDDINIALASEIISEGDKEILPETSDLKDGSTKVEANEVAEFFDVEPGNEERNRNPVN